MQIESVLTNTSAAPVTTALRTHPLLAWNGNAGEVTLRIFMRDGSVKSTSIDLEHDKIISNHAGKCELSGFGDKLEYTVESPQGGSLYFCKITNRTFTVEFFGNSRNLTPGESIRIVQKFTIRHP